MKITLWVKFLGWFIIKPMLRKQSYDSLVLIAREPEDSLNYDEKILQHFSQQIVDEIRAERDKKGIYYKGKPDDNQ